LAVPRPREGGLRQGEIFGSAFTASAQCLRLLRALFSLLLYLYAPKLRRKKPAAWLTNFTNSAAIRLSRKKSADMLKNFSSMAAAHG